MEARELMDGWMDYLDEMARRGADDGGGGGGAEK
jgi:hypothetical protein